MSKSCQKLQNFEPGSDQFFIWNQNFWLFGTTIRLKFDFWAWISPIFHLKSKFLAFWHYYKVEIRFLSLDFNAKRLRKIVSFFLNFQMSHVFHWFVPFFLPEIRTIIFFLRKFHKNSSHLLKKSPVHLLIFSKFSKFQPNFTAFSPLLPLFPRNSRTIDSFFFLQFLVFLFVC